MQTFLPYPDFAQSAQCLDPSRLGNQFYREGLTLLRGKWRNHPASRMWRGYAYHLGLYLLACAAELERRGRHYPKHVAEVRARVEGQDPTPPTWLGDSAFHAAHRSNLLRKDPVWYGRFGWSEPDNLPYIWPKEASR